MVGIAASAYETPRIAMHMWLASTTTATPCGASTSSIAIAICFVKRSCTCSRREYMFAMRALKTQAVCEE